LALEITDILFETFPKLHLDGEEVTVVLPQLPSGSIVVVESLLHFLEVLERLSRERIEPVVGGALETGWKNAGHEHIIMRVNHHLVLVLMEVLVGLVAPE